MFFFLTRGRVIPVTAVRGSAASGSAAAGRCSPRHSLLSE